VGALSKIRVLLADNHDTILDQIRTLLSGADFEIVGAVHNGQEAVTEVRRLDPDVLVIDISMPVLNGLEAASRLRTSPGTRIVVVTVHEDEDFVAAAFSAGASGYVTKADLTTDLIPAIHEALEGRIYISKSISQ
jgi:DNA-binding NarL/FixJ family response regulator